MHIRHIKYSHIFTYTLDILNMPKKNNNQTLDVTNDQKNNNEKIDVATQTIPVIIKEIVDKSYYPCEYCRHPYINKNKMMEHSRRQVCLHFSCRTYCTACDIQLNSRENYTKHLLEPTHISSVLNMQSNLK